MGVRFLLLSAACVSLMILDQREQHLVRVRQALSFLVSPVQLLVDAPISGWKRLNDNLSTQKSLLVKVQSLERDKLNAEFRLQRLAALEMENARLRELLDSQARVGNRALIAEILDVDLDPYRQRFNLNRGLVDGVYVGQALIDAQGVVGQIVKVGPLTAEAVLITDADHAVPVSVNRNGLRTIAVGVGDAGKLLLPYLTNNADIVVGDLLVSSGLGGVFPSGYPVGRVAEVRLRPDKNFSEIIAQPASALDRDREVLLVWNAGDAVPRASEAAAASNLTDPG